MSTDGKLPRLRPLEVTPFRNANGEVYFALQDMLQIAPRPVSVSPAAYFILAHFDGNHSCEDIGTLAREQLRSAVRPEQIHALVTALDESLLLETDRFEHAYAERCQAYSSAPARDNRDRWPAGAAVGTMIEDMLRAGTAAPVESLRGLIAPHLDYPRGRPCYAAAYATLAAAPPADRYVILGTNHFGRARGVVATRKDFLTPLGCARTDRAFIGRLEQHVGRPLCEHEFDHLTEHSVELQVHVLQVCRGGDPFEIVPVLCPDPNGTYAGAPDDAAPAAELAAFANALAAQLAEDHQRSVVIAAADLSHVGQRFGDPDVTTPEFLGQVERSDRYLLALLARRREDDFVAAVRATRNRTRICSVGCIYALLRCLPDAPCRILDYHQAVNGDAETTVSCAAAAVG